MSKQLAERECRDYLHAAANMHQEAGEHNMLALSNPGGMLIMVIGFLKARCEAGIIEESIECLNRLVGISDSDE